MAANQFPWGVFDALDSRRRAFLWDDTLSTIGAHCLIAWTKVCDSKESGGLGIRDLQLQNQCLLLKLYTGYIIQKTLYGRTGRDAACILRLSHGHMQSELTGTR